MNTIDGIPISLSRKYSATSQRPVKGNERKLYRVGNNVYIWDATANAYVLWKGGGGSFPQAQYLTLAAEAALTNERVFTTGSNLVGTDGGPGNPYTLDALIGSLAPNSIVVTPTTRQDNYAPVGWNGTYPSIATTIFYNNTSSVVIGGLQGGTEARELWQINVGTKLVILEHESSLSTAANRFNFPDGNAYFLGPGQALRFTYSTTINRWVCT